MELGGALGGRGKREWGHGNAGDGVGLKPDGNPTLQRSPERQAYFVFRSGSEEGSSPYVLSHVCFHLVEWTFARTSIAALCISFPVKSTCAVSLLHGTKLVNVQEGL
jgi:hypothetical protein